MSVNLSPLGGAGAQFFTNDGVPLTGGLLYTYQAGSTTPATTYTSSSGGTALANPIVLDAAGRVPTGEIWLTDGISYKFVLKDSTDVLIATWDGLSGINSNFIAYTSQEETATATAGQTVFTTTLTYIVGTNNLAVYVNGSNQIVNVNYTETDGNTVTFLTGLNVGDVVKFSTATPVATNAMDAANVSYTPAGAQAVTTNVQAKLRESVSVMDFGATGDGATDDTTNIQNAIDAIAVTSGTRPALYFPTGRYAITGLDIPRDMTLFGPGELYLTGAGNTALTLTNALYVAVYDLTITLTDINQKGISLLSSGGSYSQLNNFYNVRIMGLIQSGTVGIDINNAFTNSFFGCHVIKPATGVTFTSGANANQFFGGELRCDNTNVTSANPVVHGTACNGNGFHGTVIENWKLPILMNGGSLTIDSGCYIEAFASSSSIYVDGGELNVNGNYLNNGFIFIYSGNKVSANDNTFAGSSSNSGYPFIQYRADVATRLNCKGNQVTDTSTPGVLLRPREYYTGSAWAARSIANRIEFIEDKPVRYQARLQTDRTDVTGDGTAYTVVFGSNEQFDDGSNFSGTNFTAPQNGLYWLSVQLYLGGLVSASHDDISVALVTSNRFYQLNSNTADISTTAGRLTLSGNAFVDMETNDTAYVTVTVTGSTKVVDVLRGDATNGYTTFSGFKVA